MHKSIPPDPRKSLLPDRDSTLPEREIVVPHVVGAGPVTAVKNVLIQFSLAQLS